MTLHSGECSTEVQCVELWANIERSMKLTGEYCDVKQSHPFVRVTLVLTKSIAVKLCVAVKLSVSDPAW